MAAMRKTKRELKVSRLFDVVESVASGPDAAVVGRAECADDGGFEDVKRVPSLSELLPARVVTGFCDLEPESMLGR